jgi:hypothetical protein
MQDALTAFRAMRHRGAALAVAREAYKKGETWPEYVKAREDAFSAAHRQYADVEKAIESRRATAVRAAIKEHTAAVENLVNKSRRESDLQRDLALAEIAVIERTEYARVLNDAAKAEGDKQVAAYLATFAVSEQTKLDDLQADLREKEKELAELQAAMPSYESKVADALHAMAL